MTTKKKNIKGVALPFFAAFACHCIGSPELMKQTAEFLNVSQGLMLEGLSALLMTSSHAFIHKFAEASHELNSEGKHDFEHAVNNAYNETFETLEKELIEKYGAKESKAEILYRHLFKKENENYLINESLKTDFLDPLRNKLKEGETIGEMLRGHENLNLIAYLDRIIEKTLPEYNDKESEAKQNFITDVSERFQKLFGHYFLHELKENHGAKTIYFTSLLEDALRTNFENKELLQKIIEEIGIDKVKLPEQFEKLKDFINKINTEHVTQFVEIKEQLVEIKSKVHVLNEGGTASSTNAETVYSDGQGVPLNFLGREKELKTIREKLEQSGHLLLINAEGGIGKTTLAAKYWEESLNDYKFRAWLFCENGIVSELKKLATYKKFNIDLKDLNEDEQITALKTGLQNVSHNFLLVLDNANNPEDIEVFKQIFRGFQWHVLMTSRCKGVFDKEKEYVITHLPPSLAKDLFISNYKEDTDEFDVLLDRLLSAINYHTLLVEIFSKNMNNLKKRKESLADFLALLESGGLFLGQKSFKVGTDYTENRHKKAATTDEILNILYDFSELDEEKRFWLVNMALLPAVSYDFVFLCELFKQDKYEFNALESLAYKGWLAENDTSTGYRISPIVKVIVLEKHKDKLGTDAKNLIDNINEKLKSDGMSFYQKNEDLTKYVEIAEEMTKTLKTNWHELTGMLSYNTFIYYKAIDDLPNAFRSAIYLMEITEHDNFKYGMSLAYDWLSYFYGKDKNVEKSIYYREKDLSILIELSDEDFAISTGEEMTKKEALFEVYKDLAEKYRELGNDGKSVEYLLKCENIFKNENYEDSTLKFKYDLILFEGEGFEKKSNWLDASKVYERGVGTFEKNAHTDELKRILALLYNKQGSLHNKIKKFYKSFEFYDKSRRIYGDICKGKVIPFELLEEFGMAYFHCGEALEKLGRLKQSLSFYEEENKIYGELTKKNNNNKYMLLKTYSLSRISNNYRKMGKLNNALENSLEDIKIKHTLKNQLGEDVSFKRNFAYSIDNIGLIYEAMGELTKANAFYYDEAKIFNETIVNSKGYFEDIHLSKVRLASISFKLGKINEAISFREEASQISQRLLSEFSDNLNYKFNLASDYGALGRYYRKNKNLKTAYKFSCESTNLLKELHSSHTDYILYICYLAYTYMENGTICAAMENFEQGQSSYEKSIKLFDALQQDCPDVPEYKNLLSISLGKLGNLHLQNGNMDKAESLYMKDFILSDELCDECPEVVTFKSSLAKAYCNLAGIAKGNKAITKYQLAGEIWQELVSRCPQYKEFTDNLSDVQQILRNLNQ